MVPATPPNAAGWYQSNVKVQFICFDMLSGIPDGACPADQILSPEGTAVQSIAETVKDTAGNVSDPNTISLNIDKTAPTITSAATVLPNAMAGMTAM